MGSSRPTSRFKETEPKESRIRDGTDVVRSEIKPGMGFLEVVANIGSHRIQI
jgi:hypothetical protein